MDFSTIRYALLLAASGRVFGARGGRRGFEPMPPDGHAPSLQIAPRHGVDGKGGASHNPAEVGFDLPLPDFTDCVFAQREADADWSSIIHQGGPVRSFPRVMPAFGDALSDDQIDAIIAHLGTLCTDKRWVRGEFNFPRGLFTEKAFPEGEFVWSTAINAKGPTHHVARDPRETLWSERDSSSSSCRSRS